MNKVDTPEYQIEDQWLTQNGKEIALLYGAGFEDEIRRILKMLNNYEKLVDGIKRAYALSHDPKVEDILVELIDSQLEDGEK